VRKKIELTTSVERNNGGERTGIVVHRGGDWLKEGGEADQRAKTQKKDRLKNLGTERGTVEILKS